MKANVILGLLVFFLQMISFTSIVSAQTASESLSDVESEKDRLIAYCEELLADSVGLKPTKDNAIPGAIFVVNPIIRNGIQKGDAGIIEYLRAFHEPGGFFDGGFGAKSGVMLEVLVATKKYNSINAIKVKDIVSKKEGYVFWTEFKSSTTLVKVAAE